MGMFAEDAMASIRNQVGDGQLICGLSGGVDSSVAATLVHQAVGDQLTSILWIMDYCVKVSRNRWYPLFGNAD